MLTPALYRTRITHLRRAPVHHYFEHHSYSWYVDIDDLDDAQPDDPFWYGYFATQPAAIDAACSLLRHLSHDPLLDQHLTRISQRSSPTAA